MGGDETYSLNKMIRRMRNENSVPETVREGRPRTRSFTQDLLDSVISRAEAEGKKIELLPDDSAQVVQPPPRPAPKKTVLPPASVKVTREGIRVPGGLFAMVNQMAEMEDETFYMFYIEASLEYERRSGNKGWTRQVVEQMFGKKGLQGDYTTPVENTPYDDGTVCDDVTLKKLLEMEQRHEQGQRGPENMPNKDGELWIEVENEKTGRSLREIEV